MKKTRLNIVLTTAALGAGLVVLFVIGLWGFMVATAVPLHPDANAVPSAATGTPPPAWAGAVDSARGLVRDTVTKQNLPGLSVAVGVGGDIVWAQGFGFANIDDRSVVTPNTRFRIGTASIPLTSAGIALLVERDLLKLDEAIQTYVPEFPKKPQPVTVRQLMGHVAGIRRDGGDEEPLLGRHCERPVEGLEPFKDRDLLFEPGTQYRYSSYGWILLSAAVESAAKEPFHTFMRREVFDRLDMTDTRPDSEPRATSYFPRFAAEPKYGPDPMRPVDYTCFAGASAFLSTPSDLVRFGMAVQGGKLLKPATVELLQTAQRVASGQETGYGLGWDVEATTMDGVEIRWIGHEGTLLGGMAASLITIPGRSLVIAVVSNTSFADTETLALRIARTFGGK